MYSAIKSRSPSTFGVSRDEPEKSVHKVIGSALQGKNRNESSLVVWLFCHPQRQNGDAKIVQSKHQIDAGVTRHDVRCNIGTEGGERPREMTTPVKRQDATGLR